MLIHCIIFLRSFVQVRYLFSDISIGINIFPISPLAPHLLENNFQMIIERLLYLYPQFTYGILDYFSLIILSNNPPLPEISLVSPLLNSYFVLPIYLSFGGGGGYLFICIL